MKKILTKKGFTLIELIVVIAILAILAAILIPSLTNYLNQAQISKNESSARAFYSEYMLEVASGVASPALTTTLSDGTTCTLTASATDAYDVTSVVCGSGATAGTFTP